MEGSQEAEELGLRALLCFRAGGAWAGSLGGESLRPGTATPPVSSQLPPLTLAPPILLLAASRSSHSGMVPAPKGTAADKAAQGAAGPLSRVQHVSCRLRPSVSLPCPLLFPAALVCIPGLPDLVSLPLRVEWRVGLRAATEEREAGLQDWQAVGIPFPPWPGDTGWGPLPAPKGSQLPVNGGRRATGDSIGVRGCRGPPASSRTSSKN